MINHEYPSATARILIFFEVAKETQRRCSVAPWSRRWVDEDAWVVKPGSMKYSLILMVFEWDL